MENGFDSPRPSGHHISNEMPVLNIEYRVFYKTHSFYSILVAFSLLGLYAFTSDDQGDRADNIYHGLRALIAAFILFSLVALPNGPFTRPHPAVWRIVLGGSVLYFLGLVFALFQSRTDIHNLLEWWDPSLNATRPKVAGGLGQTTKEDDPLYAQDCRFTFETVIARVDIFVLAHSLGWFVRGIMLRDVAICWIIQIAWELTEVFFSPVLPNFVECWWDQIFFDVICCNGGGIALGVLTSRLLEQHQYHWVSLRNTKGAKNKVKRALLQFTPSDWTKVDWDPLYSSKRYLSVLFMVFLVLICDLNCFFLKHIFGVPTTSLLNSYRLALWALFATPSFRQIYNYVSDPNCKRLGVQAWVGLSILLAELLLVVKFGRGIFDENLLNSILPKWFVFIVFFCSSSLFISKRLYLWWNRKSSKITLTRKKE